MVPNCGIQVHFSERRGRECVIPAPKGRLAVQTLRQQSFQVAGPKLFNCLPAYLRNMKKSSDFKEKLDLYLATLPDQPLIGDLVPNICSQTTAKPSNSLVDVILHTKRIYGGG